MLPENICVEKIIGNDKINAKTLIGVEQANSEATPVYVEPPQIQSSRRGLAELSAQLFRF